jgi:hypothetical protein
MQSPRKLRKGFGSEALSAFAGTILHFGQVAGKQFPFFLGATRYTMSIVRHLGLMASLVEAERAEWIGRYNTILSTSCCVSRSFVRS